MLIGAWFVLFSGLISMVVINVPAIVFCMLFYKEMQCTENTQVHITQVNILHTLHNTRKKCKVCKVPKFLCSFLCPYVHSSSFTTKVSYHLNKVASRVEVTKTIRKREVMKSYVNSGIQWSDKLSVDFDKFA